MENILKFWFGELSSNNNFLPSEEKQMQWWKKSEEFDLLIKNNFLEQIYFAATNEYNSWLEEPRGRLAIILLLDQFTRNVFRDSAAMYAYDNIALHHSLRGIELGHDLKLHPIERTFMYMPLEHSEDLNIQKQCVELFKKLENDVPNEIKSLFEGFSDFARQHLDIIEKFNRFPHRNKLLCRKSTEEENEFLKQPNSGF